LIAVVYVTLGLVVFEYAIGSLTVFGLADRIQFMAGMDARQVGSAQLFVACFGQFESRIWFMSLFAVAVRHVGVGS